MAKKDEIKHQPASPLPWRALKKEGAFQILHAENARITSLHYPHGVTSAHDAQRENADYLAHVANVYPELVKALKALMVEVPDWQDALGVGGRPELDDAIALAQQALKSAGEPV